MIRVEHVSHSYRGQQVLKDISVTFQSGEIHGVVGNNGSGKTLLFKVICGYLKPNQGQVYIDGVPLGRKMNFPPSMGMILEIPRFLPQENAYQNLALLWSLRSKPDKKAIEETLVRVGLGDVGGKKVGKFSLGMKQRLGLAQAIMESPKLLILDEPFNGLDKQGVKDAHELIREQQKRGATILLSSHIAGDVEALCSCVYEMDNGVLTVKKTNSWPA